MQQRDFMRSRLETPTSPSSSSSPNMTSSTVAINSTNSVTDSSSSSSSSNNNIGGNVQAKVLGVYCKGFMELQRAYCSAKVC